MPLLRYQVVNVFATQALEGNPLAVFTDASSLDGSVMQKIAREMNLAETAFILPSTIWIASRACVYSLPARR